MTKLKATQKRNPLLPLSSFYRASPTEPMRANSHRLLHGWRRPCHHFRNCGPVVASCLLCCELKDRGGSVGLPWVQGRSRKLGTIRRVWKMLGLETEPAVLVFLAKLAGEAAIE